MNVTPTGVTNAANLSLFMVNVAYRLPADVHHGTRLSVLDLKADVAATSTWRKRYKKLVSHCLSFI